MTMNADNTAISLINRQNADVKADTAAALALATKAATRVDTTAGDNALIALTAELVILDAQADITFPTEQVEPNGIEIASGVVENAAPTLIVMALTEPGVITDETGFTISGSTLATAISGAAISGSGFGILTLTANGAVANGETVLITYNGATGNLVNKNNAGDAAGTITAMEVTNNVAA